QTHDLLGMTGLLGGDLAAARRHYDRAIALCRARDDRLGLAASLTALTLCAATYQTDTMVAALGLDQAASAGEEALALPRRGGRPTRPTCWRASWRPTRRCARSASGGPGAPGPTWRWRRATRRRRWRWSTG